MAVCGVAIPASASTERPETAEGTSSVSANPLWYLEALGLPKITSEGITGAGVKIAVLDSQINPAVPALAGTDLTVVPNELCFNPDGSAVPAVGPADAVTYHATSVVSMILGTGADNGPMGVAPGASVDFILAGQQMQDSTQFACIAKDGTPVTSSELLAAAMERNPDIISVSSTFAFNVNDLDVVREALRKGILLVVGSPNTDFVNKLMDNPFGYELNGVVSVRALDAEAQPAVAEDSGKTLTHPIVISAPGIDTAGYDDAGNVTTTGGGSSIATPVIAGSLALAKQKWPKATANQLIQSLIHNTTSNVGKPTSDLIWDETEGYGIVSPLNLTSIDPSTYPDKNPLFDDSRTSGEPTFDSVFGSESAPSTATPGDDSSSPETSAPAPSAPAGGLGALAPVLIGGGIALIVIVVVVILIVVLGARRRGAGNGGGHEHR